MNVEIGAEAAQFPGKEYINGNAFAVHKLESSQTRVFVWFSTRIFLFYKMLFTKSLEFACFVCIFKTIVDSGFL